MGFKSNQRSQWREITGDPEGNALGEPGDLLFARDTGVLWIKSFGRGNTIGWRELATGSVSALNTEGINRTTDFVTGVTSPTYATLLSLTLTSVLPSSVLFFVFSCSWRHLGAFAGNIAFNCRFRLNGGLLVGGCTDNKVRTQIGTVARTDYVPITAGDQVLDVEVTKFGPAGNTINVSPGTLPDLQHAALFMQEVP